MLCSGPTIHQFLFPSSLFTQWLNRGIPSTRLVLSGFQTFHIFFGELKVVQRPILFDATVCLAFGQDYKVLLKAPAKQDLRGFLVVLLDQRLEQGIVHPSSPDEWRVCLQDHTSLLTPVNDVISRKPRVELYLIDREKTCLTLRLLL